MPIDNIFDKEIDALLRQAGADDRMMESFVSAQHPQPDDFAAFYDEQLSGRAREEFVGHVADCQRCRQILAIQALPTVETSESVEAKAPFSAVTNRNFRFSFWPSLAFAAAFVLFAGLLVFVVLQPRKQNEISGISETPVAETMAPAGTPTANEKSLSAEKEEVAQPLLKDNSLSSNSATINSTSRPLRSTATTTNSGVDATSGQTSGEEAPKGNMPAEIAAERPAEAPKPPPAPSKDNAPVDEPATSVRAANSEDASVSLAKKRSAAPPQPRVLRQQDAEFRQIKRAEGKTFELVNGVWTDRDYNNEPLTVVKRSSDNFGQLDQKIQSVVRVIGTPIIIAWQGRAFRIE